MPFNEAIPATIPGDMAWQLGNINDDTVLRVIDKAGIPASVYDKLTGTPAFLGTTIDGPTDAVLLNLALPWRLLGWLLENDRIKA